MYDKRKEIMFSVWSTFYSLKIIKRVSNSLVSDAGIRTHDQCDRMIV